MQLLDDHGRASAVRSRLSIDNTGPTITMRIVSALQKCRSFTREEVVRFKPAAITMAVLAGLFSGNVSDAAGALTAYGVSSDRLLRIGPEHPINSNPPIAVTNLQGGELLVGIDYHAADNSLYVVTDQNRIYTVDRISGVAVQVGTRPFAEAATYVVAAFEIIPGTNEALVLTTANHNLRVSLETGEIVAAETALTYAHGDPHEADAPLIRGAAYAMDNTLYALDENHNTLARIGGPAADPSPANGLVSTIGELGSAWPQHDQGDNISVYFEAQDGMDVGPGGDLFAFKGAIFDHFVSSLTIFVVDPHTGLATSVHSQVTNQWRMRAATIVPDEFNPDADTDGDGVPDNRDLCPYTAHGVTVNEDGCWEANPVDVTALLVASSQKCNNKGVCKRKVELRILRTSAVTTRTLQISLYASQDAQLDGSDTLLKTKKAKFSKKTGVGKLKYTAKLPEQGWNVIAVVDSANEIIEHDEMNNSLVIPEP